MNTVYVKTLPTLVMFEFATDDPKFSNQLFGAILEDLCPDFELSLGSRHGVKSSYTALWGSEHADAVRAWARSVRLHVTEGVSSAQPSKGAVEKNRIPIEMPDLGVSSRGLNETVVQPCLADAERMLADQGLESTALNWVAICDHFLSLPLIRPERAAVFRLLRQAIERAALGAVQVGAPHR